MHDLLQISIMLELGNFQQQRIRFVHCTNERQNAVPEKHHLYSDE